MLGGYNTIYFNILQVKSSWLPCRGLIEDGVLIDVSEEARTSGFKIPVCIGDRLYHGYVVPPEGLEGEDQSLEGHAPFEQNGRLSLP